MSNSKAYGSPAREQSGPGVSLAAVPVSVTEATREGPGTKMPAERGNMVGPVRDRAPDGPTVPLRAGRVDAKATEIRKTIEVVRADNGTAKAS